MNRRWLDRTRVLVRAWRTRRPTRIGRVRAGLAVLGLVAAGGAAYEVQAGDTLSEIAQRNGVSIDSLVEANSIANPNFIVVGQTLTIPGQAGEAAAPAAPTTSSSGGGEATTHVVASGESLAAIAKQYGLSVQDLARANGITDANRVWAGTLLRVAAEPPPPPGGGGGGGEGGTHTVSAGESLSSIASHYGTSIAAIVDANDLTDPDRIFPGQQLAVPGASGGGPAWACVVPGATWVNDFGIRKPDGRYHEGIDLMAPKGTIINAPVGGTIEHVQGERAGNQFTLLGDDGYTYIGAHLDAYGPSGRVEKGDPIGTVGNTGNASGGPSHLHFEMHSGSVVNPYPTLQQYC